MVQDTGIVFQSLFRAYYNAMQARLIREGIRDIGSPRLLLVLRDCQIKGEIPSQRELADLLHLSTASIATSLKSLERNGYVKRNIDPTDSRKNQISITQKGLEALENGRKVFEEVDQVMLSGFSEEEVAILNKFHLRMLENLYAINGDETDHQSPLHLHPNCI